MACIFDRAERADVDPDELPSPRLGPDVMASFGGGLRRLRERLDASLTAKERALVQQRIRGGSAAAGLVR